MFNNWQNLGTFAAMAAAAQAQPQTGYGHQGLAATGQAMMGMSLDAIGNPQQQQQQQMYGWFYNQWQQNMMLPQQAFPGMMQQYPPLPEGSMIAPPAPPVEPPADVRPPLPPEPPPEDKNGSSQARVLPALPAAPQAHAGKESSWQELKPPPPQNQWQPPPPPVEVPASQPPVPTQSGRADIRPVDPLMKAALESVLKEEQEFVTQYAQWKQQYREWQQQNKNHPNKEQFDQYLSQWKHYEQQMEERRHDLNLRKREIEEKIHVSGTSAGGLTTADLSKAGMGPQQRGQLPRDPQDPSGKFAGSVLPGAPTPGERAMDSRFVGRGVPGEDPSGKFVGSMLPGAPPAADQATDSRFIGRSVPGGNNRPALQASGIHNSQQDRSGDQRESSLVNQERWHNPTARDVGSKPSLLGDKPPGLLGDKPPSLLGDKPPSLLGDKPPSLLGDKPSSLLGDKPPSLLGDRPSSATGHHVGPAYSDGSQGFGQRGPAGGQRPDLGQFAGPQKGGGHTGLLGDAPPQFQSQSGEDKPQAGQGKGKFYSGMDVGGELVEGGEDDMDLEENQEQEDFQHGFSDSSSQHFQGAPGPQRFPGPPPQRFQGPPHQQGPNMRGPGPQSFRPQGPQDFAGQGVRGQPPRGPQGLQGPGQRFAGPVQRFPGPGAGFRGPDEQQGFDQQDTDMSFQDFSNNNSGRGGSRGRGGSADFGQRGRGFGPGNARTFRGRGGFQGPGSHDSFNEQRAFGAEYEENTQFGEESEEGTVPEDMFRDGGMGRGGPDNFRGHGGRGRGRGAPDNFAGRGASQKDHVWNEPGREMGLRGRGGIASRGRGAAQSMAGPGCGFGEQDFRGEGFESYSEENLEEGGELDQYDDNESEDFQSGQQNFDGSQFQGRGGFSGPPFRGGPGRGLLRMQGPQGRGAQQGSYGQHPSRGGLQGQFMGRGGPPGQFSGPGGPQGQFGGRGGPQGQLEGQGGPQGPFRGRGVPRGGQFRGMGRGRGVGRCDWEDGNQNQGYQGSGQGQPEEEQGDEWEDENAVEVEDQSEVPEEDSSLTFGIRGGGDGHTIRFPPPGTGPGNRFCGPPHPSERFGGPGGPANRFSAPPGSRFPAQAMGGPPPRFEGPRFPGPGNERPRFPGPSLRGGPGVAGMGPPGCGGFQGRMRGPRPLMSMVFNEEEMEHRLSRPDEDGEGARASDVDSGPGDVSFHGHGSAGDKGEMDQAYSGNQHADSRETFLGGGLRQQGRYPAGLVQGPAPLRQGAGIRQAGPEGREVFSGAREQGPEYREAMSDTGKPLPSGLGRDPMVAQRGPLSDHAEQLTQRESMLGRRDAVPGVRGPAASEERDSLPRPDEWYDGPEHGGGTARDQVPTRDYGHGAVVKARGIEERWPVQEGEGKLLGPGRPFQRAPGGQEDLDLVARPPFPADDWPPREGPVRDPLYEEHLRLGRLERHGPLEHYGRPRDPYVDRLGYDPYLARDPALGERRFHDPYMDPFIDPWIREREHLADTERVFRPAESIDYGHGQGSGSRMTEDTPKAAPQVIDYGHGNKKDESSRLSDPGPQDGFLKSDRPDWSEKRFSQERSQEQSRSIDREHLEGPNVKSGRHDGPLNEYGHHGYDHRNERDRLDFLDDRDRLDLRGRELDRGRPDHRNSFERGEFDGSDRGRWPERSGSPERASDKREHDWPDRSARSDRLDALERTDRVTDREWPGRFYRPERSDHSDMDWGRSSRREEFDHTDRSEWPSRERTDHPDRHHDVDRPDRRDVLDRFDRPEPGGRPDGPTNSDIHERDSFWHDRPPRRDLPEWNDRVGHERAMERPDFRHRDFDRLREAGPGGAVDRSPSRLTPPPATHPEAEFVKVEDLICMPGRKSRPSHIVIIVRGLPGSGKTYVSKLLREKEISNGGGAARMLCLDDYFMVEQERKEVDPETSKKVTKKVLEYEYEQDMEDAYRQSLFKSFKKTVDDGFFPFIIVDATNEKVTHFEEFWGYAKSKGFQVYVAEMEADVPTCINRNIHKWTEYDIEKVKTRWEKTPPHILRLDIRWLLQEDSITEVEMEDAPEEKTNEEESTSGPKRKKEEEEEEEDEDGGVYKKSKWELDTSEVRLDKLDGLSHGMHKREPKGTTMEDYLQLPDDYFARKTKPGKKMVRWADLEERKEQSRRRELGFVVGQTQRDWERITDDSIADKALNQTKYI